MSVEPAHKQAVDPQLRERMLTLGKAAADAGRALATASAEAKRAALVHAARAIRDGAERIQAANQDDLETGRARGLDAAQLDRLTLSDKRIEAMAAGTPVVGVREGPNWSTTSRSRSITHRRRTDSKAEQWPKALSE